MTDMRETVRGIVARACRNFRPAPDCDLEAEIVSAATDAIMSEIAKARVGVKPLEWEYNEKTRNWSAVTPLGRYWINVSVTGDCEAYAPGQFLSEHPDAEAAKAACRADYECRFMDAVEIVSEPALTPHHSQTIHDAIAALRVAADKARQSEPDHPKWEGEYDLLTHHAEMLERALANAGGAPVVTDAMVRAGRAALLEHAVLSTETQVRLALTAALPLAKTEAEVRAEAESDLIEALITSFGGHETEYGDTIAEILEPYRPRPKDKTDD